MLASNTVTCPMKAWKNLISWQVLVGLKALFCHAVKHWEWFFWCLNWIAWTCQLHSTAWSDYIQRVLNKQSLSWFFWKIPKGVASNECTNHSFNISLGGKNSITSFINILTWHTGRLFCCCFVSKQNLDNSAFVILILRSFEFLMSARDF